MSAQPEPARSPVPASTRFARPLGWLGAVFRWGVGALLCRFWLTSVLVTGWLLRGAENAAIQRLHTLAPRATPERPAPRWLIGADGSWFGGLRDNAKLGAQGLATTWLLTGPAGVLWMFAWRYGWDNSFLKGYESAWIGPLTGLLGIALFIAAMLVVPMGQARLAVTRNWRSAIDVSVLWRLVRRRWPAGLALAAGYAAVGVPILLMWVILVMQPKERPEMLVWTPTEVSAFLGSYYLSWAFLLLPALIALRLAAGRWYASALVGAVRAGEVRMAEIDDVERRWLSDLGLAQTRAHPERHRLVRLAAWSTTRVGRTVGISGMAMLWFGVVLQVFVAQFFHYRPGSGWLDLPAIHAPWFGSTPSAGR